MMVLAEQTERELVGNRFAFALCAGGQQLFDAHGRNVAGGCVASQVGLPQPVRVAGDVDEVFDGECQAAKWAVFGRRKRELAR